MEKNPNQNIIIKMTNVEGVSNLVYKVVGTKAI